jgi:hypothetical protein
MPLVDEVAADQLRLLQVILGHQNLRAHAAKCKDTCWLSAGTTGTGPLPDKSLTIASYRHRHG